MLNDLIDDAVIIILKYLTPDTLARTLFVNKRFHTMATRDDIWKATVNTLLGQGTTRTYDSYMSLGKECITGKWINIYYHIGAIITKASMKIYPQDSYGTLFDKLCGDSGKICLSFGKKDGHRYSVSYDFSSYYTEPIALPVTSPDKERLIINYNSDCCTNVYVHTDDIRVYVYSGAIVHSGAILNSS